MNNGPELAIDRLISPQQPEFDGLLRVYTESLPPSECKSSAALRAMIARPEYSFLAASSQGEMAGFAIVICLHASNAALLEYMAVAAHSRGQGLGGSLFRHAAQLAEASGRVLLVEVDSDAAPAEGADPREVALRSRRKDFYRKLGCRQVQGLTYVMPPVSDTTPPLMDLLVYAPAGTEIIERSQLREWLEACYAQVYGVAAGDSRIDEMLRSSGEFIPLV